MKRVTVVLRSARGVSRETVEASVLATDEAVVDKARQQAGITGAEFKFGEVVTA